MKNLLSIIGIASVILGAVFCGICYRQQSVHIHQNVVNVSLVGIGMMVFGGTILLISWYLSRKNNTRYRS